MDVDGQYISLAGSYVVESNISIPRLSAILRHTGSYSSADTLRLNGMTSLSLGASGVCLCVEYTIAAQEYSIWKSSHTSCVP